MLLGDKVSLGDKVLLGDIGSPVDIFIPTGDSLRGDSFAMDNLSGDNLLSMGR